MKIGILGLQGAVDLHQQQLAKLGATAIIVRRPEHMAGLDGLILPGGESSTILKLLHHNELYDPIKDFVATRPTWGLCAGAILLAKEVTHPVQESLGAMDIRAVRNAYGRQLESFITPLQPTEALPAASAIEGVFIRAPKFEILNPEKIQTILTHKDEPVMVSQGHCLAASFHPELSEESTLHDYFLQHVRAATALH